MATSAPRLFAGEPDEPADALHATGLLPSQHLRGLIEHSRIHPPRKWSMRQRILSSAES